MNNEPAEYPSRNWFERLKDALLREPQDQQQLLNLLRDAKQRQLLNANALDMIEGVLQISDMQARDIMVPRSQMVVIHEDLDLSEILPTVINSNHSRFPVIGSTRDEVVGILLAKDLLRIQNSDATFDIKEIMRPAVFIPESKRLDILLKEFREERNHMAIVVDEYGGIAGLVTIEDVLEQIVGEIEDEYDIDSESYIKQLNEHHYTIKAITPVAEFNQQFNTQFSEEEYDTIGGLVTHTFGHLPKRGEKIMLQHFEFEVLTADHRRIRLLKATSHPKPTTK